MKYIRDYIDAPLAELRLGATLLGMGWALAAVALPAQAQTWVPSATKAPQLMDSGYTAVPVAPLQTGAPIHVVVSLQLRNRGALTAFTAQMASGGNVKPLTSAQFMSQYAPTAAQVQAVVAYLTSNGFINVTVAPNNLLVSADGTVGTVKSAFNTGMQAYTVNGRSAYANTGDVSIPPSLSGIVLSVLGLQNIHLYHVMANPLASGSAIAHKPTDFPIIYNAASLPSASNATIGIITEGSMTQTLADLKTFASNSGYPAPNVSVVTVGGASFDTSGTAEWNMDTQDSLAAAGGTIKQMILYTANTLSEAGLTATFNAAVSANAAQVINVSLGQCENNAKSDGGEASDDQIFQTAIAQGQTFSIASGDSGAYECGTSTTGQAYPAASPYVIAVGGTTLDTTGTTGTTGIAWASETVWSCSSASSCQQSSGGGAGGGPSLTESAPSWQVNAGVLTGSMRGVPDIAFDADPNSGALVLINGAPNQIGGTSLAAPLFTGFWARVQSMNNNALGFPATAIYQKAAANPGMFHDITSGNNGGYPAKTGWDYASGYGSLNVANFASVMAAGGTTTTTTTGGTTTTTGQGTTTTSTTTAHTTTTTTATTTTTTAGNGYTQSASATVLAHYLAGRINVHQYITLGTEYGYVTTITLYYCPALSGWTNHSNCAPLS